VNGDGLIRIGLINKVRGLRGELSVMALTDDPERFRLLDGVVIEKPGPDGKPDQLAAVEIEYVNFHGGRVIVKFKGCDDAGAAAAYRGRYISIARDQLIPLRPDSYYVFDLVGCTVTDMDGARIGELTEVLETGGNDVYIVTPGRSGNATRKSADILIPALKSAVLEVDVINKRMVVDPAYAVGGRTRKVMYAD